MLTPKGQKLKANIKNNMGNFRNLDIWKQGITIVKEVYKISEQLPGEEKYGLRSQITRAAVSVPSNIAEGSSRNSEIEFKRFLEFAIGSLFELETQFIIMKELYLIDNKETKQLLALISEEQKMINGLINRIKKG